MKLAFFAKFILVLLSLLAAAALFEIFARITLPEPENLAKLETSSLFLYENKPSAVFSYRTSEFDNQIEINSFGFRDKEFTSEKAAGTFRIAVLGDSQEEALQMPLNETWQKVLEGELTKKAGLTVESYNFGVAGYGIDQEWLTLREKVWQFSPDMVILAFSPNDVGDTYKNKLVKLNNGTLEVVSAKERAGGNFLGKLARQTYTYHLLVKASSNNQSAKEIVEIIRTKIFGFLKEERFFLSDAQLTEGPFEVLASQKNPPAEVVNTWEVVRALVGDMKKQADEHNAKFLITINIPRAQVFPADWEQLRQLYKLDPVTSSPYEINEVMAKIAKDEGILFHDPRLEAIAWYQETGNLHWPKDAHFNANGNLFMGTKVAEFILANDLLSN